MADDRSSWSVAALKDRKSRSWQKDRVDVLTDLQRRNAELAEAVKARDEFIAVAAHELRSPMSAMYLRVQQLAAIVRSPGGHDAERVARELMRLDGLMEDYIKRATMLLDVSRIAAGKPIVLEPDAVDLSLLLREAIEHLGPAAGHAGSRLDLRVDGNPIGEWDRLAVVQIIENLLSNAIKFGAGMPIEVSLAGDARTASLRVKDRGVGISKRDQARIFECFERARAARPNSGFGIGLWLVRKLVDAMGGQIDIVSAPGAGSTFTVTLPRVPPVPKRPPMGELFDPHG
jgi:signal transduction histidine kinase